MDAIRPETIAQLPLAKVESVTFYKRDQITTDLICCEVGLGSETWFFHEELEGWDLLLLHLTQLPDFRADWFSSVSQPPFEPCARRSL